MLSVANEVTQDKQQHKIDLSGLKGNSGGEATSIRSGGGKRESGEAPSRTSQIYGALLYSH